MKVMDILPGSAKGENMRGWRNWLARVPYKHEAMGSSPLLRTKYAAIAQLVEHLIAIQEVAGSRPVSCSRAVRIFRKKMKYDVFS